MKQQVSKKLPGSAALRAVSFTKVRISDECNKNYSFGEKTLLFS
jgi:hypothetical protein